MACNRQESAVVPYVVCDVCCEPLELRATREDGWPLIEMTEADIAAMDLISFVGDVAPEESLEYRQFTVVCSDEELHHTGWCVDGERMVICRVEDEVHGE